MGRPQNPTTIATDNTTADGFVNNDMVMKKSKYWDINLHWLRDKEVQDFFRIRWEKGYTNCGDYFTKHHPTIYHKQQMKTYVRDRLYLLLYNISYIVNRSI